MSKETQVRYSVKPSTAFIIQWMVVSLIVNLGLFALTFFIIIPLFETSAKSDLIERIIWASFVFLSFLVFAVIYILINSVRYWLDYNHLEIINYYRPKKKMFRTTRTEGTKHAIVFFKILGFIFVGRSKGCLHNL